MKYAGLAGIPLIIAAVGWLHDAADAVRFDRALALFRAHPRRDRGHPARARAALRTAARDRPARKLR